MCLAQYWMKVVWSSVFCWTQAQHPLQLELSWKWAACLEVKSSDYWPQSSSEPRVKYPNGLLWCWRHECCSVAVPQFAVPAMQQEHIPQLPALVFQHSGPRNRLPTLLDLLYTIDNDLNFLNFPSWISSDNDLPPNPLRRELPSSSHDFLMDRGQLSLNFPTGSHNAHVPHPSFNIPQKWFLWSR